MAESKPKAGNQVLRDFAARQARRRVRYNLSFTAHEADLIDQAAQRAHLPPATFLRQLVLSSPVLKADAGVRRVADARARLGYTSSGEVDQAWGVHGTKQGGRLTQLERLASVVPRDEGRAYYKTAEARALLVALPPASSARAEQLMLKLKRQPSLVEYAEAGIDLKAI